MQIRSAQPADYSRIAMLRNLTMSEPITPEQLLRREQTIPEGGFRMRFVAEAGGQIVGTAASFRHTGMMQSTSYMSIDVDPGHRRLGIGTLLWGKVRSELETHGVRQTVGATRDDRPEGKAFLEKLGFRFQQHLLDSELDLDTLDESVVKTAVDRVEDAGYELIDWQRIGDSEENRRRLFTLHNSTDSDTPGSELWGETPYEMFAEEVFGDQHWPAGIWVAKKDGEWLGLSMVNPVEEGRFATAYTGVAHHARRNGIGMALKAAAVRAAKEGGGRVIRAQNDAINAGMLRINGALGFRPQFGWVYMIGDVAAQEEIENGSK